MNAPVRILARQTPRLAFAFIEAELGISAEDLKNPRKHAYLVQARALFVWIIRSFGSRAMTDGSIGHLLGGRDHKTIANLVQKADWLRGHDPDFLLLCDRFTVLAARSMENTDGHA
ncbi:MAG: helix-turn-helix domain-containing protein [Sphingomonadaceae bacterium]